MPEAERYNLWRVGTDRFAVCVAETVTPILGFVFKNADETWSMERQGKVIDVAYSSLEDAADTLVNLIRPTS
jgi:hypothetical protein